MRAPLLALLVLAACRTSSLGACKTSDDCLAGSVCDTTQDTPVCVVQQGTCFPACPTGQVCRNDACQAAGCSPACDTAHVCDEANNVCNPVAAAGVTITSPAADAYVDGALQATASAHAPGGVTGLTFDLRSAGVRVASKVGVASGSDPSNFAVSISLAGIGDGPVSLTAVISYGTDTLTSAPVALTVDQNAPAIALTSDGRTTRLASGQSAAVTASVSDGAGSGVVPASVQLLIAGQAAITGAPSASQYSFAVPVTDALCATGQTCSVSFSLTAKDKANHTATLGGDPKAVLVIDRDAPAIQNISITTAADYTDGSGRKWFSSTGTALRVTAKITDPAGVAGGTVCLKLSTESAACPHPGTAGASGTYSFDLPRQASDGSAPASFTLSASDSLAASLSGASKAEHQAVSPAQQVFFDGQPPAVAIAADGTAYARKLPDGGANYVTVSAQVSDPSGLSADPKLVSGGVPLSPSSKDGGSFTYLLNAADAPAGSEGPYTFQVTAQDNLGHLAQVNGSRFVDDAAPAATVKVFKDVEPAGAGVNYPLPVANTGYTGASFIYSDTVHVKGTLSDTAGLGSATVHVDGIDFDGGVSAGAPRALGCDAGQTSCNFDVTLALNDPQNGGFHTGLVTEAYGTNINIPAGNLSVVIDAQDQAQAGDGGPAAHAASNLTAAHTTRFLWQYDVGRNLSGLAVHPDGDLIATSDAGTDTVYALAPDAPTLRWKFGGAAGLGPVTAAPVIGAGDAQGAPIYVASRGKSVYALASDGGVLWHADNLGNFAVTPALASSSVGEQVVAPSSDSATTSHLYAVSDGGVAASALSDDVDNFSSPVVLDGGVYFGTAKGISRHLVGDGSVGAAVNYHGTAGQYFGLVSDGQSVYGQQRNGNTTGAGTLVKLDAAATQVWATALARAGIGEPAFGLDGKLLFGDNNSGLFSTDPATGVATSYLTLGNTARSITFGSDGHLYTPRSGGYFEVHEGKQLSWVVDPNQTSILRAAVMDCQGRLFLAAGSNNTGVIYAVITDDKGLADTAWPTWRRDSRNSGNTASLKYGIRTASGCVQ